jgi:hypothetical protein
MAVTKGISRVQVSHVDPVRSARFDDPNLMSVGRRAGSGPCVDGRAGLEDLADRHLSVPGGTGPNR